MKHETMISVQTRQSLHITMMHNLNKRCDNVWKFQITRQYGTVRLISTVTKERCDQTFFVENLSRVTL